MQVLEAGQNKYLLLELDPESIGTIARQAGFDFKIDDRGRVMSLDLSITDRQAPLLLFDAADPGNLGWFSRCQFYVDGPTSGTARAALFRTRCVCRLRKNCPAAFACPAGRPFQSRWFMPFCSTC